MQRLFALYFESCSAEAFSKTLKGVFECSQTLISMLMMLLRDILGDRGETLENALTCLHQSQTLILTRIH